LLRQSCQSINTVRYQPPEGNAYARPGRRSARRLCRLAPTLASLSRRFSGCKRLLGPVREQPDIRTLAHCAVVNTARVAVERRPLLLAVGRNQHHNPAAAAAAGLLLQLPSSSSAVAASRPGLVSRRGARAPARPSARRTAFRRAAGCPVLAPGDRPRAPRRRAARSASRCASPARTWHVRMSSVSRLWTSTGKRAASSRSAWSVWRGDTTSARKCCWSIEYRPASNSSARRDPPAPPRSGGDTGRTGDARRGRHRGELAQRRDVGAGAARGRAPAQLAADFIHRASSPAIRQRLSRRVAAGDAVADLLPVSSRAPPARRARA